MARIQIPGASKKPAIDSIQEPTQISAIVLILKMRAKDESSWILSIVGFFYQPWTWNSSNSVLEAC